MSKLYIGIGHKCRQGKDSFAAAIHNTFPALTRVIGFADALKSHCRVVHRMKAKDAPLLQRVGVDMRESHGEDVWIRALEAAAKDVPEPVILVTDVRFVNEALFVKEHGGILVKIERHTNGGPFISKDRDPNHPSETALDDWLEWDYIVENVENRQHKLRESALEIFSEVYDHWQKRNAMAEIDAEYAGYGHGV